MVTATREADRPNGQAHASGDRPEPPNPWSPLRENLRELIDYAAYYLSVRADQVRLRVRRIVLAIVFGLMGAVVGTALLVTAAVIFLTGIGEGLGWLLGGRIWLGNLIVGLAVLVLTTLMLVVASRRIIKTSRTRTVEKYATLRQQQRQEHGHDVGSRSKEMSQ